MRDSGRLLGLAATCALAAGRAWAAPLAYEIREGLNDNAFLQDGNVAAHLVMRGGLKPRLLVAFPAGNSGVAVWFKPIAAPANWTLTKPPSRLAETDAKGRPLFGETAEARIVTPRLEIAKALLSSIRVLRDEEYGAPTPAGVLAEPSVGANAIAWGRDRLDGHAGYKLTLTVTDGTLEGRTFEAGSDGAIGLRLTALTGETPLTPFDHLLDARALGDPAARHTLDFLSYREKFLAGSWRFDTYFGRDTLISVRLLMPALSPAAVESGLSSVLARLSSGGEVAHEEDIGEYAILDHQKAGQPANDTPVYDYKMIDGSFLLAPVASAWLLDDPRSRAHSAAFLAASDGREGGAPRARGGDLMANLRFVLGRAAPFADRPVFDQLIPIKAGYTVGDWRDSGYGLGYGRYPYDVNAILVPAAAAAAGRLYRAGLLAPYLEPGDDALFARAEAIAFVWRDKAPGLFRVRLGHDRAMHEVEAYARSVDAPASAAQTLGLDLDYFALSLDADGRPVPIMNSDFGFALLFGDPAPAELAQSVQTLMKPFPAGLLTDVGMVVANPAHASAKLQAIFTPNAYSGVVVWSWQQALFAAGLQRQLERNDLPDDVRADLKSAQTRLWAAIDATRRFQNSELWSWRYENGRYRVAPFGESSTDADESNAAQLWSTVFLAIPPPHAASIH